MQLIIRFQTSAFQISPAYQHQVQSMIYRALSADPAYAAFLHDRGYAAGSRQFRLFTFGRLQGRYSLREGMLCFSEGLSLEIRSVDGGMMQLLLDHFRSGSLHRLGNQALWVEGCTLSDRHIVTEEAEIEALAPITVYQTQGAGKTRYYAPEEPAFSDLISENAGRKWASFYAAPLPGRLQLTVSGGQHRKVVTRYKGLYITGWLGRYRLAGPPQLLDFLYQTGLGAKNAQGFGMFDPR